MNNNKPEIDRIFHALGDPTRRAMVEKLSQGPASVSRLAVVQHLQVLEECGLVRTEKLGRVRTCRLDPAGFAVATQWLADRRSLWERSLDRLADFLRTPEEPL
jgi:DNA-binding transcriptional ArsR family regulator